MQHPQEVVEELTPGLRAGLRLDGDDCEREHAGQPPNEGHLRS
jgi:hypothetical protein